MDLLSEKYIHIFKAVKILLWEIKVDNFVVHLRILINVCFCVLKFQKQSLKKASASDNSN